MPRKQNRTWFRSLFFETLSARRLLSWTNHVDSLDVDLDRQITPLDVLATINEINVGGSRKLPDTKPDSTPFIDVDIDGFASALDVLALINHINSHSSGLRQLVESSSVIENVITFATPLSENRQAYRIQIQPNWGSEQGVSGFRDLVNVYVVNRNSGETSLDRGEKGTSIFSMTSAWSEIAPGISTWDGSVLEIDTSAITIDRYQKLVVQLVGDGLGTSTTINLTPLTNETIGDLPRSSPISVPRSYSLPGSSMPTETYSVAGGLAVEFDNWRMRSGILTVDARLINGGPSEIGRAVALLFPGLGTNNQIINSSGVESRGPYISFRNAIPRGGLGINERSSYVTLSFDVKQFSSFQLKPLVLTGAINRAPDFSPIAPITLAPGDDVIIPLIATDPDGDPVTFQAISSRLPTGGIQQNNELRLAPSPSDLGSFQIDIRASDGALATTQSISVNVVSDGNPSTRIRGRVLAVDSTPLVGLRVEMGSIQAITDATGSFTLNLGTLPPAAETIRIRGDLLGGSKRYPFIAEKLDLLFGRDLYLGFRNTIQRPIYLPELNSGQTINPTVDITVSQQLLPNEAPVAVAVRSNTLFTQQGTPFAGQLSITEVPPQRTPISLPPNLSPDLVITIQPGEMTFATPAPLTFPNRAGYRAGTILDLWSINPVTGAFDDVGDMQVTADGQRIETIRGGIRNSSWHFPVPPPTISPIDTTNKPGCGNTNPQGCATSTVDLVNGFYREHHDLPSYSSLGQDRSISLTYSSNRASPTQVLRFNTDLPTWFNREPLSSDHIGAAVSLSRGNFRSLVTSINPDGTTSNLHRWFLNDSPNVTRFSAGVNVDLNGLEDGLYTYSLDIGAYRQDGSLFTGASLPLVGSFVKSSNQESPYGEGWTIEGLSRLAVEDGGSNVSLIVGSAAEFIYTRRQDGSYQSPPTDFSVLTRQSDGTFTRRMTDGTLYKYDARNRQHSVVDRNGNETRFEYGTSGELRRIIDPVGLVTELTYANGKLTRITLPDGRHSTFDIDSSGNLRSVTDPDGSRRQFDYDSNHRLVREINPRGFTEHTEYDSNGRVNAVTRADGSRIQYLTPESQAVKPFNGLNRTLTPLSTATRSDNSVTIVQPSGNVVRMTVNSEGRPLTVSDSVGLRSTNVYAASQLPTKMQDGRGIPTDLTYDARGNVTSTTLKVTLETTAAVEPPSPSDGFRFEGREQSLPFSSNWFGGLTTGLVDPDSNSDIVAIGYRFLNGDARQHLAYMKGDGAGGFADAIVSPATETSNNATQTSVRRIDGDNVGDVVIIDPSSPPKLVFYKGQNNGQFTFAGSVLLPGNAPADLAFADLDGDTDLDIVYSTSGSSVLVQLTNSGNFAFQVEPNVEVAGSVRAIGTGKFTSTETNQVVIFNGLNISVLAKDQTGSFSTVWESPSGFQPRSIRVFDVDRDGFDDIYFVTQPTGNARATFGYFRGSASGMTLADAVALQDPNIPPDTQVKDFELTDLQRDNQMDAILSLSNGMLINIVNNGQRLTLGAPKAVPPGGTDESIAKGGWQDFLVRRTSGIQILNSDVSKIAGPTYIATRASSNGPSQLNIGDFNGDGNLDIVVLQSSALLTRYLGDGNGVFLPVTDRFQAIPMITSIHDINGDGRDDILGAGPQGGFVAAVSDTTGQIESIQAIDESIRILKYSAIGDINRDGFPDMVVVGSRARQGVPPDSLYLYMSTGSGNFATYQSSELDSLGIRSQQPVLKDLNSDGFLDLITISGTSFGSDPVVNRVGVRLGTASGGLNTVQTIYENFGRSFDFRLVVGDVNGDSSPDIVVAGGRHTVGNYMELLLNNGAGQFPDAQRTPIPNGFLTDHMSMADVNNDGLQDVIVGDGALGAIDRTVGVFLGSSSVPLRRTYSLGVTQSQETVASVTMVDLDSDSKLDLITSVFGGRINAPAGIYVYGLSGIKSTETLTQRWEYDPSFAKVSRYTDELGRSTSFSIDPTNGNIDQIAGPLGLSESFTYLSNGMIDTYRDSLGRIVDYDYNALGQLEKITFAKGTVDETSIALKYDSMGNPNNVTDGRGAVTRYEYDTKRRLIKVTDAENSTTIYQRDAAGNVTRITDALGRVTRVDYDSMNRMTSYTDPAGVIFRMSYDKSGNLIQEIDGLGKITEHRYDVANRRVQTIDPDGGVIRFRYDINDNLVSVTDPLGNVTRFFYDERYRVVRELDPLGQSSYKLYDGVNNLIAERDRNGRRISYRHDARNRLVEEHWLGPGSAADANFMAFTYDAVSNLKTANDKYSSYTFTYDSLNRLKSASNEGTPNAASVLLGYAYDDNSNRTRVSDTINGVSGATVINQYDALNRIENATQTGTGTATKRVDFGYNVIGQYTDIARSNNADGSSPVSITSFTYDTGNRLRLINHLNSLGNRIASFEYGYDLANRITRITDKNQTIDYGYDKRDQLVSANYGDAARTDEAFKFDANGNRVESNAHGTAYRTGPGNRLLTDGVYSYEYDNEGNLTKRTEIAMGNTREFQWDHRNRLTMLSDKNASGVVQQVVRYTYDSFGRRISKQVDTTPLDSVDAAIEQYVYDGDDVILDFVDPDGSGPAASQQTTRYLRGPGIDNLLAIESASGTNWVLQDHLGSTRALVSAAGVLVQSIDYDSFGKAIVTGSPLTRYLYTGRELDAESGLFYYRARYYDSSTGRFSNEDPIGFAAGDINLSRYVFNSPLVFSDPTGGFAFVPILVGAGIGAVIDTGIAAASKDFSCMSPAEIEEDLLKTFGKSFLFGAASGGFGKIGRIKDLPIVKKAILNAGINFYGELTWGYAFGQGANPRDALLSGAFGGAGNAVKNRVKQAIPKASDVSKEIAGTVAGKGAVAPGKAAANSNSGCGCGSSNHAGEGI